MTIILTPEELSGVLSGSELIHNSAKAIGWKKITVSVYPSMDSERPGFEIDVWEDQEGVNQ